MRPTIDIMSAAKLNIKVMGLDSLDKITDSIMMSDVSSMRRYTPLLLNMG